MNVGEQVDKSLSISIENPDVLNIPHVLMVSPRCTEHPPCTHGVPPLYWTSLGVLMVSPTCIMISPRCTHGIPPMYWVHIQGKYVNKIIECWRHRYALCSYTCTVSNNLLNLKIWNQAEKVREESLILDSTLNYGPIEISTHNPRGADCWTGKIRGKLENFSVREVGHLIWIGALI